MKHWIALLLIVGCIVGYLWYQDHQEQRQRAIANAEEEYKQTVFENKAHMDAEILRSEMAIIRLTLGDVAAKEYELCKQYPPTVKANQIKCDRLFAKFKSIKEHQAKW